MTPISKWLPAIALGGSIFLSAGTVHAGAFTNGSFETGSINPGVFTTLGAGSTAITGWTVLPDSVDYIGTYWAAQDGNRSVDLSGGGAGGLQQTFDTNPGSGYLVQFYLAGNGDGPPPDKLLKVLTDGGATAGYSFPTTGKPTSPASYASESFFFVATGASTTLTFQSLTGTPYGPVIDNVSVTDLPEPASALVLGVGLLGLAAKRSRQRA